MGEFVKIVFPETDGEQAEMVRFVNSGSASFGAQGLDVRLTNSTATPCFRTPIPEIALAAQMLNDAVSAHLRGDGETAAQLIRAADMPEIREWVESLWGKKSPYIQFKATADSPPFLSPALRAKPRMPSEADKRLLLKRDGYHCRFCGIPVIRPAIRTLLHVCYPEALPWGGTNATQHAAFEAMWVQYDHVLPHARGGTSDLENLVITCAPCNYGRMNYTLDEVHLLDPRTREPIRSDWDGLERMLQAR